MDPKTTHKELVKQVKKLHKTLQKLVARSREFGELRKLLREEQIELAMYVVPILNNGTSPEELDLTLTDNDRAFLKQAGITF